MVERGERRLDRRTLPATGEVRAQPGAQVTGAADVQHLTVRVAEQVDAGGRRRAGRQRPLDVELAGARRGELDEVGEGARPALLRETDQAQQDLGRRLRVGQRAVTRLDRRPEEVGERRQPDAPGSVAEHAPGEPDRVHDGRRDTPAGEPLDLPVEEPEIETCVVGDEARVTREGEEAADGLLRSRRAEHGARADPRDRRDRRRDRNARVDEGLERRRQLVRLDALRPDLADP